MICIIKIQSNYYFVNKLFHNFFPQPVHSLYWLLKCKKRKCSNEVTSKSLDFWSDFFGGVSEYHIFFFIILLQVYVEDILLQHRQSHFLKLQKAVPFRYQLMKRRNLMHTLINNTCLRRYVRNRRKQMLL